MNCRQAETALSQFCLHIPHSHLPTSKSKPRAIDWSELFTRSLNSVNVESQLKTQPIFTPFSSHIFVVILLKGILSWVMRDSIPLLTGIPIPPNYTREKNQNGKKSTESPVVRAGLFSKLLFWWVASSVSLLTTPFREISNKNTDTEKGPPAYRDFHIYSANLLTFSTKATTLNYALYVTVY
jgi:hypothetical protein